MTEAEVCSGPPPPFAAFVAETRSLSSLRAAIAVAARRSEAECVPPLIAEARLAPRPAAQTRRIALALTQSLREASGQASGVAALMQEFSLSSQEGVALMCLAEALLRIPDAPMRDALIRDKIKNGDWASHLGHGRSLFLNATAWGLIVTGKLAATTSEASLSSALARLVARGGEPLIRLGVDLVMRMLGEQFVMAPTIEAALQRSRQGEQRGFLYSYDMLGEAALTRADAEVYRMAYANAIDAVGAAAQGKGLCDRSGVSIKLSALHPRYERAQRSRVVNELGATLYDLMRLARDAQIAINIDAEEADRLDLSLDLFETLCADVRLGGWNGLGFVVQAYQKRAPFVIDHLIDLARRTGRRLMVRLVKGAYWDSEIKRAQVEGLGYPVFTRKVYTDVCYFACARRLLAARDAVFPQFATHNVQTIATIHTLAGSDFSVGDWEFQCLHGMGERLYEQIVDPKGLNRPCRIYAPVGAHDALLPYLVRRLLENGANSSFVRRLGDLQVPIEALIADPAEQAGLINPRGAPNPGIKEAHDLFGQERRNAAGFDFADERALADLAHTLAGASRERICAAAFAKQRGFQGAGRIICNPADRSDVIGEVVEATERDLDAALSAAARFAPVWACVSPARRAQLLRRTADLAEARRERLIGLVVREAGRTIPNALAELREAVDFLRYYAAEAERGLDHVACRPLGPVACISPWNFPLSIFVGQIAAALAAGNVALAKPAEQTPLVAYEAMRLFYEAGVPPDVLHYVPGDGETGAALIADPRIRGVLFTGSMEAARQIGRRLALRLNDGRMIPFIAETGGQNAMIVDSSALAEQVVVDILASAFDSAGQRCSCLRVLCLQDEIADRILSLLARAMQELTIGRPDRLAVDLGPLVSEQARAAIQAHVDGMRARGRRVISDSLPADCTFGAFAPPRIIEIESLSELTGEVFGPVLHVVRFARRELDRLVDQINATGYALTFAVHSRIDDATARILARIHAGNIYVNRNMIGAVVGVQPFGGHGLSGTGPKAGGPLYLRRLLAAAPPWPAQRSNAELSGAALAWRGWLTQTGRASAVSRFESLYARSPLGDARELPGPVGERNVWDLLPRGIVLCVAASIDRLLDGIGAALASGNRAIVDAQFSTALAGLPADLVGAVLFVKNRASARFDTALFEGTDEALLALAGETTARDGPIAPIFRFWSADDIPLEWLLRERCVSVNTAAAGGNASLMASE